jgi:predicted transcriptional regulator of viral defense system
MNKTIEKSLNIVKSLNSPFRMNKAIKRGLSRYMLYRLRDQGYLVQISRGLYILKESENLSQPDLVTVSCKIIKGVICLISALDYHNLTTQIPHSVHIALPKDSRIPRLNNPPIQVYRYGKEAYSAGIEEHEIDGVPIRIYSPEKTLADCFKFRNTIGMDIVLEALKMYQDSSKGKNYQKLMEYAKICRVGAIIRPYIEMGL